MKAALNPYELTPVPGPPMRFRALMFRRPLGDWRPRAALAWQDGIAAGCASREWDSGQLWAGPGFRVHREVGIQPISPAEMRLAQALAFHRKHGRAALALAEGKMAAAAYGAEAELWGEIVEELRTIKEEARRAEHPRERR